jgi:hypothetical protein
MDLLDFVISRRKKMNRENLQKLATGLRGPLLADFDMDDWCDIYSHRSSTCGTVGCAVGHASYLVAAKIPQETWSRYAERVFGINKLTVPEFIWCFFAGWQKVDNTPEGAADRIEWMLNKGLPGSSHVYKMLMGYEPLCYRTKTVETPSVDESEVRQAIVRAGLVGSGNGEEPSTPGSVSRAQDARPVAHRVPNDADGVCVG